MSRWCGTGNHWVSEASFRIIGQKPYFRFARDCLTCEQAKKTRPHAFRPRSETRAEFSPSQDQPSRRLEPTVEFPGVDIDRIHYVRGAVRKKSA